MNLSLKSVQEGEFHTSTVVIQTVTSGRMLVVTGVGTSRDPGKSVAYALEEAAALILQVAREAK